MFTLLEKAKEKIEGIIVYDPDTILTADQLKDLLPPSIIEAISELDRLVAKRDQLAQEYQDQNPSSATEISEELKELENKCQRFFCSDRIELEGPNAGSGDYLEFGFRFNSGFHTPSKSRLSNPNFIARIWLEIGQYRYNPAGLFEKQGADHECAKIALTTDEHSILSDMETKLYGASGRDHKISLGVYDKKAITRDALAALKIFKQFEEQQNFTSSYLQILSLNADKSVPDIADDIAKVGNAKTQLGHAHKATRNFKPTI